MEIKEVKTDSGDRMIEFADQSASDLRLWVEERSKQGKGTKILYLDTDGDYFKFLQEDIAKLLPYLQAFAKTGTLEPATESSLQGESTALSILAKHRAGYSQQFAHEKERIQTGMMHGIINPDASQAADRLESKLEALRDLEDAFLSMQGEEAFLDVSDELATMQEAGVAMAQNITDQGERIQALENLVREWVTTVGENEFQGLQEQTAQLLGEEQGDDLLNRIGKEISDQWKGSSVEKLKELLDRGEE